MSELSELRLVLDVAGVEDVAVERDIAYATADSNGLGLDLYRPPPGTPHADSPRPAVVFVSGYSDPGFVQAIGCKFKEMAAYVDWARSLATLGIIAVTYENARPFEDAAAAIGYVAGNAKRLGIDPDRIGVWACSGNVPTALALLSDPSIEIACAALCYGYLMDLGASTIVADTSAQFRFSDAMQGKSITEVRDSPFLIVRAGNDEMPGLLDCMDQFIAASLTQDLPMTLINYPGGIHAFDLNDHSDRSKAMIREIMDYLTTQLGVR